MKSQNEVGSRFLSAMFRMTSVTTIIRKLTFIKMREEKTIQLCTRMTITEAKIFPFSIVHSDFNHTVSFFYQIVHTNILYI